MAAWLILEVELHFNQKLKPITSEYRADLQAEGAKTYYGMHFVGAPSIINPGECQKLQMILRAFPEDACADFQVGKKVFLKEGPFLVRAEGTVLQRFERESSAKTITQLAIELESQAPT